jgi:(2Fe-2S) ferredoxin
MANELVSPYMVHVFVCTNDRKGERQSCADNNSQSLKDILKEAIHEKGWKVKVRVSTSGCMGLCTKGANVLIYPQQIWFSESRPEDAGRILATLEKIVESC